MKPLALFATCALALCLAFGCKSTHEEGVKSNVMTQWTTVNADTMQTTEAAKAVLMDEGLKDVKASSTAMDGTASAKMADGTKIKVDISKDPKETFSKVSVNVGTMGSPTLGANIAKKIKMRAEGTMPSTSSSM
ncbi:MAG TPA: DUF3568 family protein [Tepidisphaeraceae bacterium]|jgi:hypothetical protein|nr:DUF3568 family protein [Tepidisphaeraceae bacterium]